MKVVERNILEVLFMNNLYTVDEVAIMTGLTRRTIQNYLKDGKLKGRKIGVQWRFTEENIQALFNNQDFQAEVTNSNNKMVLEFLNSKERLETEICSVIDYPCLDKNQIDKLTQQIIKFVNTHQLKGNIKFSYQYIKEHNIARFIITGKIQYINQVLQMVN
ncbi:DNA-binding protein [Neobacillus notoginsengisoli]|uniref:DNA-binding protein n=2 Tax=Neobacillus notoginsengisoli TaxID=1578198 RepID=A0A417YPV9_9BACI|nr:DNA-binding protein [Neobacillus notoginsengisoli]